MCGTGMISLVPRGRADPARPRGDFALESAGREQDEDDEQQQRNSGAGKITPTLTIRPSRQCADQ